MDDDRPSVSVQHLLLVRDGKIDESWRSRGGTDGPYALRGVSYRYSVAPDVEFPTVAKPPWSVYLRLTGWNAGPTRVLFGLHYRDHSGNWGHLLRREMDRAIPFVDEGEETRDILFQLPYLLFGGVGLHSLSVHFWYDGVVLDRNDPTGASAEDRAPEWDTSPEVVFGLPDWSFGTVDYFWVERQP